MAFITSALLLSYVKYLMATQSDQQDIFMTPSPCSVVRNHLYNGSTVDCSKRHLKDIPGDLPGDTVELNFEGNNIQFLKNSAFVHVPKLVKLNLGNCQISGMHPEAFIGLRSLQSLKLNQNKLDLNNSTYPPNIFRALQSLEELDLSSNDPRPFGSFPDFLFVNLSTLMSLSIDSFHDDNFGKGFMGLTNLEQLILAGYSNGISQCYCGIRYLKNDTFSVFRESKIRTLDLRGCRLIHIESNTFWPLSNIETIILANVFTIPMRTGIRALFGLRGRNVSKVDLSRSYEPRRMNLEDIQHSVIDKDSLDILSDICIKHLDLSHARLLYIDVSFVNIFSKCLQHLDISNNRLCGDVFLLPSLSLLKKLEYFDISFQLTAASFGNENHYEDLPFSVETVRKLRDVNIVLPQDMKSFYARSFATSFGKFPVTRVSGSRHLEKLDLSDNGIRNLTLHIVGLGNVKDVDFSRNNGSGMTEDFLSSFVGASKLSLVKMNFDEGAFYKGGPVYMGIRRLKNLQILDISQNNIRYLPDGFFKPLKKLSTLYVSNNGFVSIPADAFFHPTIQFLDLSLNSITYLKSREVADLDDKSRITIQLYGNPLSCSCKSLSFIYWIFTSNFTFDQGGNYTCVDNEGSLTTTEEVNKNYNLYWTSCQSRFWFPFAVVLMCVFALVIVSSILVKKKWTLINHHIMILLGRGVQRVKRSDFAHDVFVAHGNSFNDCRFVNVDLPHVLENQFKLSLVLPDRDFLPGKFVADNIVESVHSSWKVMVIATEKFLQDPWSFFVMKTASYAVSDIHPNKVILLLVGDVNRGQIPEALLNVVEEDDIFQLDNIPATQDEIWKDIRASILKKYP